MQHAKKTNPISAGEKKREDNRGEYLLLFPFSAPCVGVARAAFVVQVTSVRGASTWVLARMSVRGSHSATRTNLFRALMLQRRVSVTWWRRSVKSLSLDFATSAAYGCPP